MRHSIYNDMREGKPIDPTCETHLNDLRSYQGGSPPIKLLRKSVQDNSSSPPKGMNSSFIGESAPKSELRNSY